MPGVTQLSEVVQEFPYRFTIGGRLEGFTLRGNPKAPEQDGGSGYRPAWNYSLADIWVTGFSGDGLSMPWREDLKWKLDGVEITASSKIARRFAKERFYGGYGPSDVFAAFLVPESHRGLLSPAWSTSTHVRCRLRATESGIRTIEIVGNPDAFGSLVTLDRCYFMANGGWGISGRLGIGSTVSWNSTEAAFAEWEKAAFLCWKLLEFARRHD